MKVLVANRGEIAIRVFRAAAELGIESVAIHSTDDARSLHTRKADSVHALRRGGAAAYLDIEAVIGAARETGCDTVHPGYGFLSESAEFARRCHGASLRFVGPKPETLEQLGDKAEARALAQRCEVPVLAGSAGGIDLEGARAFMSSLPRGSEMMIKAVSGGGGRGIRAISAEGELEGALERCRSEAEAAFGDGSLYAERRIVRARHIEIQALGDGGGQIVHLGERDCSIQRRHQKLVEIAPAPELSRTLRDSLCEAALRLATAVSLESLGTFEFLVDVEALERGEATPFAFIEANPRLQVEHTVTEATMGVDLVRAQLEISAGRSLEEIGLADASAIVPRGFAIQARVNLERLGPDGSVQPSSGTLSAYQVPTGPGVRVDHYGYSGYATSTRYDSLLAKVIGHSPSPRFADAAARTARALREFQIEGVQTNLGLLQQVLQHPDFRDGRLETGFLEQRSDDLFGASADPLPALFFDSGLRENRVGAQIDAGDPLAVLEHGRAAQVPADAMRTQAVAGDGAIAVCAPLQGTVLAVHVVEGERVSRGQSLLVLEAMKMEHVLEAPNGGLVQQVAVGEGDTVHEGFAVIVLDELDDREEAAASVEGTDFGRIRPDLAEVLDRHAVGLDDARPEAVARRRKTHQRTARENVEDLCDPGTFVEYGPLVIAAQRRRRSVEDLIERTPADGMVSGIGSVNGELFEAADSRCVVMSYDYTVLAGTQGQQNHRKKDRLFELAEKLRRPVVFFTEGGGGRPGDTDGVGVAGLDCLAFQYFGKLSGLVPLVGINSGRCFAGNAALLGCCDVVIATEGSNIGMGGPAMIEGGGLGVFRPDEVGPMGVQVANGVVDIPVADEEEAVRVAKLYLSYFQGALAEWSARDQRLLRSVIPENRLRVYDVRNVIETLADEGSVLELRRGFGPGMVTAFIRIEGRPIGVVANNPTHLAGAIDSPGADKAARFMQLCDAFDLPLLFLCDTPGIMVGPEVEKTALVRHASRMFVTGASLSVPFFTIVLRKGYGLGAQAMAGGSFKAPLFTVAWPTGEFGGMGLEGAVKLGFRKELEAVEDPQERRELFQSMVDRMYAHGKAVNMASHFEIDEVIDPLDSRRWILSALVSAPPPPPRSGKKRPCVDTW